MKVQIEMELDDLMVIVATFSPNAKNDFMKAKGEAALQRMEQQIDGIVSAFDHQADEASFH